MISWTRESNSSKIISGLTVRHTHPFKSAALHLFWHVSVKGGTGRWKELFEDVINILLRVIWLYKQRPEQHSGHSPPIGSFVARLVQQLSVPNHQFGRTELIIPTERVSARGIVVGLQEPEGLHFPISMTYHHGFRRIFSIFGAGEEIQPKVPYFITVAWKIDGEINLLLKRSKFSS